MRGIVARMSSDPPTESSEPRNRAADQRESDATIAALREEIDALKQELDLLRRELKRLLGRRGGRPMTHEGQRTLFDLNSANDPAQLGGDTNDEAAPAEPSADPSADPSEETPDKKPRRSPRSTKKLDLSMLPRKKIVHELPPEERRCPTTGVALVPIGERVSEELDYTRAELSVIEHHRVLYGPAPEIAKERQIKPIAAPLPPSPIEDCKASGGLLAQILLQKYGHHLPLYRQEDVFKQAGLKIPRQTLCDWVMKAAFELSPIADELMRQIRAGPVMALDDSPVKCQGAKGSGYSQGYLWTFVNPEVEGVAYRFTPGRGSKHIEPFISAVLRFLVGDGYSGHFAAAKAVGVDLVHGGCWSHSLRKFRDAIDETGADARLYMSSIGELFDIEREADGADLSPDERVTLRRRKGRPVLARILKQTRGWKDKYSTSGKMAAAIKYVRNQWVPLKCFLLDGRVPIHNNACERAIRPIAVGRRNWLFVGSKRGGKAAAIIYTLLASCRLANADPWVYLREVLGRVATHPANQVADLVPARWAALREVLPKVSAPTPVPAELVGAA